MNAKIFSDNMFQQFHLDWDLAKICCVGKDESSGGERSKAFRLGPTLVRPLASTKHP